MSSTYRDWLYNQLGSASGGSSSGGGLEDVIVEGTMEDIGDGWEVTRITVAPESGKRYIIDVPNDGIAGTSMSIEYNKVVDECQIWLRIDEYGISEGWIDFSASDKFNWANEPDFAIRNTESDFRYIVISIQNNLAVCSEFTLGSLNSGDWASWDWCGGEV